MTLHTRHQLFHCSMGPQGKHVYLGCFASCYSDCFTPVKPYFRCKENLVQYQHHSRWVVEITHCSTHITLCTVPCIHMPCFRCLLQFFKFLLTVFQLVFWVSVLAQMNINKCFISKRGWLTRYILVVHAACFVSMINNMADYFFRMHNSGNACLNDPWHSAVTDMMNINSLFS
jgi:hypothetical protein